MGLAPFLKACGLLVAPGKNASGIVGAVREWRDERLSSRRSSSYPPINIYNMPSSKGLQGDVVVVIGLSKDLFPRPGADVKENSRLLYVTMTRAKKELYLFSARRRPGEYHVQGYFIPTAEISLHRRDSYGPDRGLNRSIQREETEKEHLTLVLTLAFNP